MPNRHDNLLIILMVCQDLCKHRHRYSIPISISNPPSLPNHPKMPDIPPEVVTDILSLLPVKSLMRFRSVSKPWCSLIDSRDFMKMHLKQSAQTASNLCLLLGFLGIYAIDMDSLDSAHALNPPFSSSDISNSCNGLTLVRGRGQTPYIWNPFTRKYKNLPDTPLDYPTGTDPDSLYTRYGFGYDSLDDDYKVLRAVEFRDFDSDWIGTGAKVYSLKSNSWKKLEDFPCPIPRTKAWGVHVNGALHTVVPLDYSEQGILAFDLCSERSYMVPKPKILVNNVGLSVDAMDGCLCLLSSRKKYGTDVWIMKKYGVKESWTKLLAIAPPLIEPYTIVSPLAYSKSGDEVLLNLNDEKLVWYDLTRETTRDVPVRGLPFRFYAEVCVASLVPVDVCDRGNEIKKPFRPKKRVAKIPRKRDGFLSEGFKLVL